MTVTWERLNGYVDGQLDATMAAEVAALIARDPDAAARVATLHRLKAATMDSASAAPNPPKVPAVLSRSSSTAPGRLRTVGIAASVVALIVASGLWMAGDLPRYRQSGTEATSEAVGAYRSWIADRSGLPGGQSGAQSGALAPDLSDAGLRLVFVHPNVREGGAAMFGYLGARGCKLGLWVGPSRYAGVALSAEPRQVVAEGDLSGLAWWHDDRLFVVLAQGMDTGRLRQFASLILKRVKDPAATAEQDIAAAGALHGTPCRA